MKILGFHGVNIFRSFFLTLYSPEYFMLSNNWEKRVEQLHEVFWLPTPEMQQRVELCWSNPQFYLSLKRRLVELVDSNKGNPDDFYKAVPVIDFFIKNPNYISEIENLKSGQGRFNLVFNIVQRLKTVLQAAFPDIGFNHYGFPILKQNVSLQNIMKYSAQILDFYHMFIPDLWEAFNKLGPDVVFLFGAYPDDLVWTVPFCTAMRREKIDVHICLVQSDLVSLFGSFANIVDMVPPRLSEYVDSIILYEDYSEQTIIDLIKTMEQKGNFEDISNLLTFKTDGSGVKYKLPLQDDMKEFAEDLVLLPAKSSYLDFIFPNDMASSRDNPRFILSHPLKQYCYWNQCRFCTINTKKLIKNDYVSIEKRVLDLMIVIEDGVKEGVQSFSFFCEAIPPDFLEYLASELIKRDLHIQWFFEGRFDSFYTDELIELLCKSGCKGAMFGLESFNEVLMRKMKKHEISMRRVRSIIRTFDSLGMRIHLNAIYGFPCESAEELRNALSMMSEVFNENNHVTFILNRFKLRSGSYIAGNPEKFEIKSMCRIPDSITDQLLWETTDGINEFQVKEKADECISRFEKVLFGASVFRGERIDECFRLYNGHLLLSMVFYEEGNFLKRIQNEIRIYNENCSAHVEKEIIFLSPDLFVYMLGNCVALLNSRYFTLEFADKIYWNMIIDTIQSNRTFRDTLHNCNEVSEEKAVEYVERLRKLYAGGYICISVAQHQEITDKEYRVL